MAVPFALVTTRSGIPSRLKSPLAIPPAFAPTREVPTKETAIAFAKQDLNTVFRAIHRMVASKLAVAVQVPE